MKQDFVAQQIKGKDIMRAFPLARLAAGQLSLDAWQRFAAALGANRRAPDPARVPPTRGLIGVKNTRGYLLALCSYMVTPDLCHGRRLDIDNLVALDLIDSDAATASLMAAIEHLARDLDCPAFVVHLPPARAAAAAGEKFFSHLAADGTLLNQIGLYKTLDIVK
ncbi:MAG: hypothetical protein HY057_10330 [Rhodospirillales bacterium]|nr:hypothetical protein [Rhodospirillales bacterium]